MVTDTPERSPFVPPLLHAHLAETLRAGGASKRAVEHALNDASVGRFGASSRNAGSGSRPPHPKAHGVVAPRVGRAGTSAPPEIPAHCAGIKPREAIARDAPERETWNGTQTKRGVDLESEKAKLAATMTRRSFELSTRDGDARQNAEEERRATLALREQRRRDATAARRTALRDMSPDDLCDELAREIDERWAFLDAVTRAGRGGEHRARVMGEIAQRVRQMKRLDEMIRHADGEQRTPLGVPSSFGTVDREREC